MNKTAMKHAPKSDSASKETVNESTAHIAHRILRLILEQRRLLPNQEPVKFEAQIAPHLEKVQTFVDNQQPIVMVLPAFPAKSPNRNKTMSHLPDKGEFLALENLVGLCQEIENIYAPGAKVIICSDGRVFADIIHVKDEHVSDYVHELRRYAMHHYPDYFDFFNLEDVFTKIGAYDSLREEMMIEFGETLQSLRKHIKEERQASTMYLGITRFMLEDFSGIDKLSHLSRTALHKMARLTAYRVIQRSNAWSRLLQKHLPFALRLSIHPQELVSEKIGIYLISKDDQWTTPWHAVLVKEKGQFRLMPKAEAVKRSFILVYDNGHPSHFETPPSSVTDPQTPYSRSQSTTGSVVR
ncbi:L-tyrosine/L-tryptophan isonitrile synthase family protein [Shewanella psychropiezotolerans]|nr:isocyanide synthase family protein [Shewanella psychropiezotolerans]